MITKELFKPDAFMLLGLALGIFGIPSLLAVIHGKR